jgi:hypothetical protein
MHVRLPYAFPHQYFNVDGKKPSEIYFHDWIEGEVREVEEKHAPLAVRWQEYNPGVGKEYHVIDTRYYDGGFYTSAGYADGRPLRADDLTNPNGPPSVYHLLSDGDYGGRYIKAIESAFQGKPNPKLPKPSAIEFDIGDTKVAALATAQQSLDGLLVIDGAVWKQVHEPVLVTIPPDPLISWPEIYRRVMVKEPTFTLLGAPPHFVALRMDSVDKWEKYRAPIGKERVKVEVRNIEIHLPNTLAFDEERNAMSRAVEAFLQLLGPDAWKWETNRIVDFTKIRDRYQVFLGAPKADPIENILEAIPDFLTDLQPLHERYRAAFVAVKYATSLEPSIDLEFGVFPS